MCRILNTVILFAIMSSFFGNNFVLADLFVSDTGAGNVYRYASDGTRTLFFATGSDKPFGLAFDNSNELFVSDYSAGTISKFTLGGTRSVIYSGTDVGFLACDENNNLFTTADWNIWKINNGVRSPITSGMPFYPGAIACDGNRNLFVVDNYYGNIYEFKGQGSAQSLFASGLHSPNALTFDSTGNLYVADDGSIYKFTADGKKSVYATGYGLLVGLVFDGSGNLFMSDAYNKSIYRLAPDGTRSIFANGLNGPTCIAFTPVPEPSTLVLLGMGGIGLIAWTWRGRKA